MAYASVADVEAGFRPLSVSETDRAYVLLDRAHAMVLAAVPSVAARVTAGTLPLRLAADVEVAMVERLLRNPGGYRTESIGGWSGTRAGDDVGALSLLPSELVLLRGVRPRSGSIALTVPVGRR